jgi:predicted DNA-binding transcriptional regulator YafY
MLTPEELKAIMRALDQVKQIVEGAQARADQAAETLGSTGYPAQRLTRQK